MLEDPSYASVVRWGDEGDSFVVLEVRSQCGNVDVGPEIDTRLSQNEKFTKCILPKHFKHSNFASFVRQLNKYDFHKVRQNNEEGGPSPYGLNVGAWSRLLRNRADMNRHGSSSTQNLKQTTKTRWTISEGRLLLLENHPPLTMVIFQLSKWI